ncbi:b1.3 [Ichnoviriform fugitivi]|uniref:B1.3 n=1 Tax=Ichnoviriform fugitivi TaxID=265522 RepID=Q5BMA9_9VIRU|nr:b1.3 [Ichnoviriform fugitivi]AAX24123.1 b1.3 [Ichnoviriform fugitivi]
MQLLSKELCIFVYTSSANTTTTVRMPITTESVLSMRFVLALCSQSKVQILSSTCQAVFTFTTRLHPLNRGSALVCKDQVTKDLSSMITTMLIVVVDNYLQAVLENGEKPQTSAEY